MLPAQQIVAEQETTTQWTECRNESWLHVFCPLNEDPFSQLMDFKVSQVFQNKQ